MNKSHIKLQKLHSLSIFLLNLVDLVYLKMILLIFNKLMIKKQTLIMEILSKKNHLLDSIKVLFMKVVGEDKLDKDKEFKFGQMVQGMKDNLLMIKQMEKESLYMLMVIYIKEIGQMIKHQVLVFIIIIMEQNIKDNG